MASSSAKKSADAEKKLLSFALGKTSSVTVYALKQLIEKGETSAERSGAFKRKLKRELAPSAACFQALKLPPKKGSAITFFGPLLGPLFARLCESDPYREAFLAAAQRAPLELVLYFDDATAGNVLATASSKKMGFVYLAIQRVTSTLLKSHWVTISMVPRRDLKDVEGGLGQVFATLLEHMRTQMEQPILVCGVPCRFKISHFVGDYDALVELIGALGAAANKPCLFCKNVLAKHTAEASFDNYFCTISESDAQKFDPILSSDLHSAYDHFVMQAGTLRAKSKVKELETAFGFHLHGNGLLRDRSARDDLCVHNLMLDACHLYYANGVACAEVTLYMTWMRDELGITVDSLATLVHEVDWHCADRHFSAASARRYLFHEPLWRGDFYKHSSTACWFVLPLVLFYRQMLGGGQLDCPQDKSFRTLLQLHMLLMHLRNEGLSEDILRPMEALQRQHHEEFKASWGEHRLRPKHHLRFHLPSQYRQFGYNDTFSMESKHREWKRHVSQALEMVWREHAGTTAQHTLPRLLHMQLDEMSDFNPGCRFLGKGAFRSRCLG